MTEQQTSGLKRPIRTLITGSTGFIGHALSERLVEHKEIKFERVARSKNQKSDCIDHLVSGYTQKEVWTEILCGKDVVVHTAGISSFGLYRSQSQKKYFYDVNVEGVLNLAAQAALAGVKTFIFLSTVKVHGEFNLKDKPFTLSDQVSPQNPYARAKFDAEQGLLKISEDVSIKIIIIRVPFVYGAGAKGNLERLAKLVKWRVPLPILNLENQRSFVCVENLADFIIWCISEPSIDSGIYYVKDTRDYSTKEFVEAIATALNTKPIFFPFPVSVLEKLVSICFGSKVVHSLLYNLTVMTAAPRRAVTWMPRVTMSDSLNNWAKKKQQNDSNS